MYYKSEMGIYVTNKLLNNVEYCTTFICNKCHYKICTSTRYSKETFTFT